jgi:hypothetical protein
MVRLFSACISALPSFAAEPLISTFKPRPKPGEPETSDFDRRLQLLETSQAAYPPGIQVSSRHSTKW